MIQLDWMGSLRDLNVLSVCVRLLLAMAFGGTIGFERGIRPVSYTHLDVYKRQTGKKGGEMMKYSEQFMEHIEYAFAAFCKIVLRNAAISAYRDFGRKQKYEVSLDYLMSETSFERFAIDNYFEQYVYEKPTVFVVQGKEVVVTSKRLADALANLSEQRLSLIHI